jgi:hypothetical protein
MQKINLFVSYYDSKDKERQKELEFCKKHHSECGYFNEIINFSERPTYNDFFKATREYPNDINILTNSDIYFNESILECLKIKQNECYALTRWELDINEFRGKKQEIIVSFESKHSYNKEAKARHSQDVWVINGAARNVDGWFHLGVPGCDNRIAHELIKTGYDVKNPSDIIQCIHKHKESERNYNIPNNYPNGKVPPPYKWVFPGGQSIKKNRFRI